VVETFGFDAAQDPLSDPKLKLLAPMGVMGELWKLSLAMRADAQNKLPKQAAMKWRQKARSCTASLRSIQAFSNPICPLP